MAAASLVVSNSEGFWVLLWYFVEDMMEALIHHASIKK
jgi:hypothetical protein